MKYALIRANTELDISIYKDKLTDFKVEKVKFTDWDDHNNISDVFELSYIDIETPLDFYRLTESLKCKLIISNSYRNPISYRVTMCPTITIFDNCFEMMSEFDGR